MLVLCQKMLALVPKLNIWCLDRCDTVIKDGNTLQYMKPAIHPVVEFWEWSIRLYR
jgi:hypothetical protein